jgi:hypothetical protein
MPLPPPITHGEHISPIRHPRTRTDHLTWRSIRAEPSEVGILIFFFFFLSTSATHRRVICPAL